MDTTPVKAIKQYFEKVDAFAPNGGQKVSMDELKQLSKEERDELGKLIVKETGENLILS